MALQVDFTAFEKAANNYENTIPEVGNIVKKLQSDVVTVKSGWQGQANRSFDATMDTLTSELNSVANNLNNVWEQLKAGEKDIAASEDQSTQGFTQLAQTYTTLAMPY